MNWLNLEIRTLRSPSYIGSDPAERATWINVLAFCCEQENGGRIIGAKGWKDRQWQQQCAVTHREVMRATKLLRWDGDDLVVTGYPHDKEMEVQEMRALGSAKTDKKAAAARENGALGGRPKTQREETHDNPTETHRKEGEGKGKEGEEERKEPAGGEPTAPARKPSGPHQQFIADWMEYFEKRNGTPYAFSSGRDGKAAAQLRHHFKSWEEAKRFITSVHARAGDGYPFANAETLYDLANNIAKLQAALAQKSNGPHPAAPKPLPTSEERYGPGQ